MTNIKESAESVSGVKKVIVDGTDRRPKVTAILNSEYKGEGQNVLDNLLQELPSKAIPRNYRNIQVSHDRVVIQS